MYIVYTPRYVHNDDLKSFSIESRPGIIFILVSNIKKPFGRLYFDLNLKFVYDDINYILQNFKSVIKKLIFKNFHFKIIISIYICYLLAVQKIISNKSKLLFFFIFFFFIQKHLT